MDFGISPPARDTLRGEASRNAGSRGRGNRDYQRDRMTSGRDRFDECGCLCFGFVLLSFCLLCRFRLTSKNNNGIVEEKELPELVFFSLQIR